MNIIYHDIIHVVNNVLFVNKPKGMTSFDVCFKLRKVLNTKKIGHTGTLDPNASGVMIILSDKASKANQFLVSDNKTYEARVLYGIVTDTLDIDGNIIEECSYEYKDEKDINNVLQSFLGKSKQIVPITSAIKINGKKLYEYQRENKEVELPERDIEIYSISLKEIHDDGFTFICKVSSGTYIRSLVRDILIKLNQKGTLSELKRIAIDDVNLSDCDNLEDILSGNYYLHNIKELLEKRYPLVEYENIEDIKNAKKLKLDCTYERILICDKDEALAIYERNGDIYKMVRGLW